MLNFVDCTTSNKISVVTRTNVFTDELVRISGYCGTTEVIAFHIVMGKWSVATSTCFPSDIQLALQYQEAINKAFMKLKEVI